MSEPTPVRADELDPGSPPRAPRWVRISGILAVVLALAVLALVLLGGGPGKHGPGRHGGGGEQAPTEPGNSAPAGGR